MLFRSCLYQLQNKARDILAAGDGAGYLRWAINIVVGVFSAMARASEEKSEMVGTRNAMETDVVVAV